MAPGFGSAGMGGGMPAGDRPSRGTGRATTAELSKSRPKPKLKKVMPEVWKLVKPRRVLLSISFLLMLINRACSFVLPVSSKYLINGVMLGHKLWMLPWIIGTVASRDLYPGHQLLLAHAALIHRGPTPHFRPAQTGAGAHRPPARRVLRRKPYRHARRPHHDRRRRRPQPGRHRPGRLRRRRPHRHLRLRHPHPHQPAHDAAHLRHPAGLRRHPAERLQDYPPHLRERAKINAEVTGRLTESLGGVRVVKGYHAEESEAKVFAGGVTGCSTTSSARSPRSRS